MIKPVLIRGGGDLASGIALRLFRSGFKVVVIELPQPLAVRRKVSFAEAVYEGEIMVETVTGRLTEMEQVQVVLDTGKIPVLIDPDASILLDMDFTAVVDARLTKKESHPLTLDVPLQIGLGPGFHAGRTCHAVIETQRGHNLGRVIWEGPSLPNSGQPEGNPKRVLRAPVDGQVVCHTEIGAHLEEGELIAEVISRIDNHKYPITSPLKGVLRGMIHPGIQVTSGLKIGDVDPRDDPEFCFLVSDKALAVGGGVLEAILSKTIERA
jgi:xanthine dehydrogenase accessory factor